MAAHGVPKSTRTLITAVRSAAAPQRPVAVAVPPNLL